MAAPLQWHTEITVAAPRERVWAIADDITLIPRYHPEVRQVELISGTERRAAGVRYRCTIPEGRKGNCIEEITEYVPGSRFVTAFPEDSWGLSEQLAEFTVETVVEPVPEGTRIRLNAYYRPRSLLMKLLNPMGLRRLMARRAFLVLAGVKRLAEEPAVLTHRIAGRDDLEALRLVMDAAISELQKPFLDADQIESSRTIMGIDTQLVDDGTYFIVEIDGEIAGCGGWSRRATLYGGDHSPGRDASLLDPARDAAPVRAMYTHPRHARKGVGRLILALCEEAARAEGFEKVELVATMSGEPLYRACGYEPGERFTDDRGGVAVPLLRMSKRL